MATSYEYSPAWDAGARTVGYITYNGELTFCAANSNIGVVCGLGATSGTSVKVSDILYGFFIEKGKYCVIESGVRKTSLTTMPYPLTEFKITRLNGVVKYYVGEGLCCERVGISFNWVNCIGTVETSGVDVS
jgi:hypothetical protein